MKLLARDANEVNEMMKDYLMMKKEVARLEQIIFGYTVPMINWGVAQYGIEAAMPKGSKGKSQSELKQMDLREQRQHNRLIKLRAKVILLERYTDSFSDLPTNIIYDRLLDGWTYRAIAEELNVGVTYVKERKHYIISVIVSAQNAQNAQDAQDDLFLQAQ